MKTQLNHHSLVTSRIFRHSHLLGGAQEKPPLLAVEQLATGPAIGGGRFHGGFSFWDT